MKFLAGYKTIITMTVALLCALYSTYVEAIPAVDSELWAIAVPVVAILLRFITKQPISIKDLLGLAKAANDARGFYNEKTKDEKDSSAGHEGIGS